MFNLDNVEPIEFSCGICKVKTETHCVHCGSDFCPEHLESGYCFECYEAIRGRLPNRFSGPDHYLAWLSEWQQMGMQRHLDAMNQINATRYISDNPEDEKIIRNPDAKSVESCMHFGCLTSALSTCEECGEIFCQSHMNGVTCHACSAIIPGGDENE